MTKIFDLNVDFSTNKNTIVRIKRNFNDCGIFLKYLSRNYNEYLNDEFPETKEYKIIDFAIRSEDSYPKNYNKKLAGELSFFEIDEEKYCSVSLILKKDFLLNLISSIENNGKDYVNNLIINITIEPKFLKLMDLKKKKGISSIPLRDFSIMFKIGENKEE